jgi:threonylcarbamoyladenosine tRNA methylthiotransferase MtaB
MRRKYTKAEFKSHIDWIRSLIPNIAITTDVIVGFPGETEEMFDEMKAFIKEIGFSELHVFPYSKRSGTKASEMIDQINGVVKSMRVNALLELNEKLANQYIQQNINRPLSVLFEKSDEVFTYGHSDTYIYIKVAKDVSLHNHIHDVTIQSTKYKNTFCKIKEA